jgi:hypothetical protein
MGVYHNMLYSAGAANSVVIDVNTTSSRVAGDLQIANAASVGFTGTPPDLGHTWPAGWTVVYNHKNAGWTNPGQWLSQAWRVMQAGDPNTITVTFNQTHSAAGNGTCFTLKSTSNRVTPVTLDAQSSQDVTFASTPYVIPSVVGAIGHPTMFVIFAGCDGGGISALPFPFTGPTGGALSANGAAGWIYSMGQSVTLNSITLASSVTRDGIISTMALSDGAVTLGYTLNPTLRAMRLVANRSNPNFVQQRLLADNFDKVIKFLGNTGGSSSSTVRDFGGGIQVY